MVFLRVSASGSGGRAALFRWEGAPAGREWAALLRVWCEAAWVGGLRRWEGFGGGDEVEMLDMRLRWSGRVKPANRGRRVGRAGLAGSDQKER